MEEKVSKKEETTKFNPLRNETIVVRHIVKQGSVTEKHHVLYGGMAEGAVKTYTVPVIGSTGNYKDVLTKEEKAFFEELLGVNLSVYVKNDNYWDNYTVDLTKHDNILDLSNPNDYIKYKVLLANNRYICPSRRELDVRPLATYEFVIISQGSEDELNANRRKTKAECYKLAGKIENDFDTLKVVIETLEKRPMAEDIKIEFLANRLDEFIDSDYKEVYNILTDPALPTRVLIRKATSNGIIVKMGDFYYLKNGKDKTPMCGEGKDPTLTEAINYLNNPKNQEVKFSIEAQLKD